MVTVLADEDIRKEVLNSTGSLDKKDVNETIGFIEAKEMKLYAMRQPANMASVSLFKYQRKTTKKQVVN